MAYIICALALLGVTQQSTPRALYEAASRGIAAKDYVAACDLLEQLAGEFPDSKLAVQSRVHLAECQIATGRAEAAFATLMAGLPLPLPDLYADEAFDELLSAVIESVEEREKTLFAHAATHVAQSLEADRKWRDAIKWQRIAIRFEPNEAFREALLRITLRECLQRVASGATIEEILNEHPDGLEPPVLFAFGEALFRTSAKDDALKVYLEADRKLQSAARGEHIAPEPEQHDWKPVIALRIAELQLLCKQPEAANSSVLAAKKQFPSFGRAIEFDFLLARSQLALIQFDAAERTLESIASQPSVEIENKAKAVWMLGELAFLRGDYRRATERYLATEDLDAKEWSQRAELQRAKCCELLGESDLAIGLYEKVAAEAATADVIAQAQARLEILRPNTLLANPIDVHGSKR